jgi:GNAT superfamily N-acetyltransferase
MEYREANVLDLNGILELYSCLNPEEKQLSIKKAEDIWNLIASNPGLKYFIAAENGKVLSTCNISIIPNLTRGGRPFAIIENVVTDPAYRKKGLGKGVVKMAVGHAKKENCYKVILMSSVDRQEAHAFYEKIGFNGNSKKGYEMRIP